MNKKKIVLGYSGGLDTTYLLKHLTSDLGYSVVCVTLDIGQNEDLGAIKEKAERLGCEKALVVDGKREFAEHFIAPSIQANALYQGVYPMATAIGRPYIGFTLANIAKSEGTNIISHGCTGKGNDQVRLDLAVKAIIPDAVIVDPIRDEGLSRDEEIAYLKKHRIDEDTLADKVYSIDQNLWGRSICAGVLEDPWEEPPPEVYDWTRAPQETPDKPALLEIEFARGLPVALDGEEMSLVAIIEHLNKLGGLHGVGRIDHIEDRIVGLKSREIYEAPAARILIEAHKALEALTLTKHSLDFKERVAKEFSDLAYNGFWFSTHTVDLLAYLHQNQQRVNGHVRVKLHRGSLVVSGRKAAKALYDRNLITYSAGSTFNQAAASHFIQIYGQQNAMDTRSHLLVGGSGGLPSLSGKSDED